jgi:hypothetical protein
MWRDNGTYKIDLNPPIGGLTLVNLRVKDTGDYFLPVSFYVEPFVSERSSEGLNSVNLSIIFWALMVFIPQFYRN